MKVTCQQLEHIYSNVNICYFSFYSLNLLLCGLYHLVSHKCLSFLHALAIQYSFDHCCTSFFLNFVIHKRCRRTSDAEECSNAMYVFLLGLLHFHNLKTGLSFLHFLKCCRKRKDRARPHKIFVGPVFIHLGIYSMLVHV